MKHSQSPPRTEILLADVRCLAERELFERLLLKATRERRQSVEKCRFEKAGQLSLAGGILLGRLLEENGIDSEIGHDAQGRPVVRGRADAQVSLTHSYPYAAAVISPAPCGIDIENRGRDLTRICERYYLEAEKEYAAGGPGRMTDIWCRKECVVKCGGGGDVRYIDTFAIPEDYTYLQFPLEGFSFEVLVKRAKYRFRILDLKTVM